MPSLTFASKKKSSIGKGDLESMEIFFITAPTALLIDNKF